MTNGCHGVCLNKLLPDEKCSKLTFSDEERCDRAIFRIVKVAYSYWEIGQYADTNIVKCLMKYYKPKTITKSSAKIRDHLYHMFNREIDLETVANELKNDFSNISCRLNKSAKNSQPDIGLVTQVGYKLLSEILYDFWEEADRKDSAFNTDLMRYIIHDEWVVEGVSNKGVGHNEHVVPRVLIRDYASEMFRYGATVEEVADMIKRNLKIVKITKNEAYFLDNVKKLRDRMPNDDWKLNGQIYTRLKEAGIEWERVG